jgi:2,3-dihydroxybenzoate decarboxylase
MSEKVYRRIAVEEAFVTQAIADEWRKVLGNPDVDPGFALMGQTILGDGPGALQLHRDLLDLGEGRIRVMDECGIDMQLLSITAPGVQVFDKRRAVVLAQEANDVLADAVQSFPDRFAGLAALAPQDPRAAADELVRCVNRLGFRGAIVNSHTLGRYLDDRFFWPIFEALQSLNVPVYLHPTTPSPQMIGPFADYGLYFAGWGFAVEAGTHAMRLIMSGLFDEFPRLKVILGHMGEGIPFWLQRIDNRYLLQVKIGAVKALPRLPSEYFLENFFITTSGVTSEPALRLVQDLLGPERIMFAADYPYESTREAVEFMDKSAVNNKDKRAIYAGNAERLFGLGRNA